MACSGVRWGELFEAEAGLEERYEASTAVRAFGCGGGGWCLEGRGCVGGGNGAEQLLSAEQAGVDVARGKQPVVADLEELVRQDVQEESADELLG